MDNSDTVELPIDGVLDLHAFRPAEAGEVVEAYLEECRKRGILSIRIIHGKGMGELRRTVHARLGHLDGIASFRLAGGESGGWGATLVELQPMSGGKGNGDGTESCR